MGDPNENQEPGAAGDPEVKAPASDPTKVAPPATPTMEYKDGAVFAGGKKMVKESDLMALKQSSETAAEKAQTAHSEAIDAKSLELSAAQTALADSNAKLTEAREAQGQGATTDEEVARIKQERQDALDKVETLTTDAGKALELKRALLVIQYSVPVDSLADKTMTQLDSFEEAAKALATSRGGGPGNYAIGGGAGGAAPKTNIERATEVIAGTPIRGVREPVPQK